MYCNGEATRHQRADLRRFIDDNIRKAGIYNRWRAVLILLTPSKDAANKQLKRRPRGRRQRKMGTNATQKTETKTETATTTTTQSSDPRDPVECQSSFETNLPPCTSWDTTRFSLGRHPRRTRPDLFEDANGPDYAYDDDSSATPSSKPDS